MILLSQFIKESTQALQTLYPVEEARSVVLMLCEQILGTKSYTHIVEPEFKVPQNKMDILKASMDRLEKGEPIQYVIDYADFYGRSFHVTPDVLIPRPETELLCREAIQIADMMHRANSAYGETKLRILDLCTGSGCIAWTMSAELPYAEVVAVDISESALKIAQSQPCLKNDKKLNSPRFVKADLLDLETFPDIGSFDIILSNPPYIKESEKADMRKNVLDYEPSLALFVSDENPLIFYEKIAQLSKRLMSHNAVGLVEINEGLGPETAAVMKQYGFTETRVIKDINDKNRIVRFK